MDQGTSSATTQDELSSLAEKSAFIGLSPRFIYAIAAGVMLLAMVEAIRIFALQSELQSTKAELHRANDSLAMISLRLNSLGARDLAYQDARIVVAWDAFQHQGVITTQNLPAPAVGYNYQLWVLDPGALTPYSAGIIHPEKNSASFAVKSLSTVNPGFAITLEPGEGSPQPTSSILFAVAPGQ